MSRLILLPQPENQTEVLQARLTQEFQAEDSEDYRQPLVAIEPVGDRNHLLVIWDAWRNLGQGERSRLIMDAYEAAKGREAALNASVAMGLTQEEAQRLGFSFKPATE